ncbi:hypothetical protein TREES_T100021584 [Tupaia chinensis]|uniref:Uncharacterized protein n=1 Tax=Tupaia chinensis TaxID=246437 RepID=L9K5S1_TUPCH|nr:hypothetical protein TREES_T100021584 [Tupaia chinensis]
MDPSNGPGASFGGPGGRLAQEAGQVPGSDSHPGGGEGESQDPLHLARLQAQAEKKRTKNVERKVGRASSGEDTDGSPLLTYLFGYGKGCRLFMRFRIHIAPLSVAALMLKRIGTDFHQ